MNYEQRLKAAAKIILTDGARAGDARVDSEELGVKAKLKPHQVEGVSWLIRRYNLGVNVILGDEMGLGKTLQAVSLLSYLKVQKMSRGPFLVLCPLSVTDGWITEMDTFAPKLKALRYIGDKENRRILRRTIYKHINEQTSSSDELSLPFDVLLTTYDIALADQDFLSQMPWSYAVIDEAQRLKNPSSVLHNVLRERYLIPRRLLMTGTPIQNNLTELWALMHFCMPSVFGKLDEFLATFKEAGDPSSGHDTTKVKEQLKTLRSILGAFMLRRTKSKLIESGDLSLPPLTEITVLAPLVSLQKKVYMSILRKELPKLLALSSGGSNHQSLQNIVIQLRKACSHPYLFPGIEPEPYEEGEHLVQASGKLIILDRLLQKLHEYGHRVLLFAQMTHTLDILQDFLELRKYSYERLDGSIRAEERFAAIRSFSTQSTKKSLKSQADQNGAFVFMISTRAGGVGLNLVAADTVIFYERDWNPQVDKQALQRAHRIGQMNNVLSINLVTGRTVEEVIMRRAERKLQLSHNVVGDNVMDQDGKETSGVEPSDLRSIIFGLHLFDPDEVNNGVLEMSELNTMAEKVISVRNKQVTTKDERKFELNPADVLNGNDLVVGEGSTSLSFNSGFDESSYLSWVEKFKNVSQENMDMGSRRNLLEEKRLKLETAKKKADEKKLSKWEELGYHSLSVEDPISPVDSDMMSDSGSVQFVYGDCTQPSKVCPSEPTIVFSCVDDSGHWGRGGMFDALSKLSASIPDAYQRASEFGDLHLGDLHLIRVYDEPGMDSNPSQWVALAVVQSYNPRRKVPRSKISIPDLESCLSKASFSAAQSSASIHMPRIGYQDASDRAEWYSVERLLRKYASIYGIKIYVYYFKRSA
ncbi:probable helicase CHR10 isoform X2 [Pyrus x bretschneideri]|uniref:probable helicase CHR10 isoform X2 n=1 Tax=Pyrus x bretschneideri TaxID=225117 RepID=UPI00202FE127|nr:probable helicase CHR10 isoform X2 [Pyrus x bretschneideri]